MTTPQGYPEQEPPAPPLREAPPPRGPADADLRMQIEALADQVRRLAHGSGPALATEPTGAVAYDPPSPPQPAPEPPPGESLTNRSNRLLGEVLAMAELAAAEIRAAAEREANDIRERAAAAIHEADQALARYRQALGGLAAETERIEAAIAALAEQGRALDEERRAIERALRDARRR
jgi:hypothetical protein